jgi:hypothetical protein
MRRQITAEVPDRVSMVGLEERRDWQKEQGGDCGYACSRGAAVSAAQGGHPGTRARGIWEPKPRSAPPCVPTVTSESSCCSLARVTIRVLGYKLHRKQRSRPFRGTAPTMQSGRIASGAIRPSTGSCLAHCALVLAGRFLRLGSDPGRQWRLLRWLTSAVSSRVLNRARGNSTPPAGTKACAQNREQHR